METQSKLLHIACQRRDAASDAAEVFLGPEQRRRENYTLNGVGHALVPDDSLAIGTNEAGKKRENLFGGRLLVCAFAQSGPSS